MNQEVLKAAGLTPEILKEISLAIEHGGDQNGDAVKWYNDASQYLKFDDEHRPSWIQED